MHASAAIFYIVSTLRPAKLLGCRTCQYILDAYLGCGEGEEQSGPVDQHREAASLQSHAPPQLGEGQLRNVVSVTHGDLANRK